MTLHNELLALVGKDIEFLPAIASYVDEFDIGMRATVLRIESDGDDGFAIHFTFAKFEDYNHPLESTSYWDDDGKPTLTAREAGHYKVEDYLYVEANWQTCVKILDGSSSKLFDLFMVDKAAQPDINYVGWLEALALAAMPHLKADG